MLGRGLVARCAYDSNFFWHMARYKCWVLTTYLLLTTCDFLQSTVFSEFSTQDNKSPCEWFNLRVKKRNLVTGGIMSSIRVTLRSLL